MERIQAQIVDITRLVNPQISLTFVEASAPQAVGSHPPLEAFECLCTTKSIRNRSLLERRPRRHWKSQLCKNRWSFRKFLMFLLWDGYRNKSLRQPHVLFQEIPEVQVAERIQVFTDDTQDELHVDQQRCAS